MQYKSNNSGIDIFIIPEYVDSQNIKGVDFFVWSYRVEIENNSDEPMQLISRYWKITDENGDAQEINGIGEQPILAPNTNFKYTSGVHLHYPSGIMKGFYEMKRSNGEIINVATPAFSLDVPSIKITIN